MSADMISDLRSTLKCDVCDNCLSYFPIFVTKNKNICGRCPPEDGAIRITAYEAAVAFHKFSCRYKNEGCCKKLLPKEVPEHEKNCFFRCIQCSLLTCDWEGTFGDLISHFEQNHSKLILKGNEDFEIDLISFSDEISQFCVYDNQLLIVSWEFDSKRKKLGCLITHYQEEIEDVKYVCRLILKYASRTCSTTFSTDDIIKLSYHDLLEDQFEVSKISGFLTFAKSFEEMTHIYNGINMLALLKCSVCSAYVLPPIYALPDGAIYCKLCCNDTASVLSNSTLNSFANLIEYPCKNQESGCSFAAIPSVLEEHQEVCRFRIIKCGFNIFLSVCLWESHFAKIESHIIESHKFVQDGGFLTVYQKNFSFDDTKLIKFESYFFHIIYGFNFNHFYLFLRKTEGVPGKFDYLIELRDINGTGNLLVERKSCSNFDDKFPYENIQSNENTVCFAVNEIAEFTRKRRKTLYLTFKIKIFKS